MTASIDLWNGDDSLSLLWQAIAAVSVAGLYLLACRLRDVRHELQAAKAAARQWCVDYHELLDERRDTPAVVEARVSYVAPVARTVRQARQAREVSDYRPPLPAWLAAPAPEAEWWHAVERPTTPGPTADSTYEDVVYDYRHLLDVTHQMPAVVR